MRHHGKYQYLNAFIVSNSPVTVNKFNYQNYHNLLAKNSHNVNKNYDFDQLDAPEADNEVLDELTLDWLMTTLT